MSDAISRELLHRYLRQRAELGVSELFLDRTTPDELLARLRAIDGPSRGEDAVSARGATSGSTSTRPVSRSASRSAPADSDREEAFETFRAEVLECRRCRLAEGRTTVVFGEGDRDADLMAVGEAPGHEEDRTGRPFVGAAGGLLDRMLAAIGFPRSEVFICNVLKCRPPGNRDPWPDEVASCRPYLRRQIEFVKPKAICAFGRFAGQELLNVDHSLRRMRGVVHELMGIPLVVTYHPAALLRNEAWKRDAWEDLKMLRKAYDEAGGRG